uniref:Uncharacterized protein n=2 Tax=Ciona intestinalis TaxID=7719 RepID=H2XSJ0_CIOIN
MSPVHESSPVKGESPMGGAMSLTLQALQEQVADYELEIAQYEQVQHDWEIEKESLQKMLERYRSEIGVDATNDDINAGESLESVVVTNDNNGVETASEQRPVEALLGELKESELQLMEEKEQLQTTIKNLEDKLKSTVVE